MALDSLWIRIIRESPYFLAHTHLPGWRLSVSPRPDPALSSASLGAADAWWLGAVAVAVRMLPVTFMSGALVLRGGGLIPAVLSLWETREPRGAGAAGRRATMTWDASGLLRAPQECATMGRQCRHYAREG